MALNINAIVIHSNNNFVIINKIQNLKELQILVDGNLQLINLDHDKLPGIIYVDEESKLKGYEHNQLATMYCESTRSSPYDILGTAVLVGQCDKDGNATSYTEDMMKALLEIRDKFKLYPTNLDSCNDVYDEIKDITPKEIKEAKVDE